MRKTIEITLKDGFLWTQIFSKDGEIVSSYISDDEVDAMKKAIKFLKENPKYLTYNKENLQEC